MEPAAGNRNPGTSVPRQDGPLTEMLKQECGGVCHNPFMQGEGNILFLPLQGNIKLYFPGDKYP